MVIRALTRSGKYRLLLLGACMIVLAGCSPAQEWFYESHDSQGRQYPLSGATQHFASVDAFRHSIGVVVHNADGTSSYANAQPLIARLQEAGITHVAGSIPANPSASWAWYDNYNYSYLKQFQQAGITWALMTGAPNDPESGTAAQEMAAVDTQIDPGMVDGLLWPNEYDVSGDPNWAANEASFGAAEYAAVKSDPVLHDRPVIGPSLVNDNSPALLGNQIGSMDTGGIHPYTQCASPTPAYDQAQMARAGVAAPGKAVWATEAGNTTALNETSGMRPCSEPVQAVYALRTYLQQFTDGIGRTYTYELAEESADPGLTNSEDHFGLLRSDYSEKPAFVAIKNLLGIVGYGAPVTATPLALSLSGDTAGDLQYLVLQRSDNSYVVALWRTASIWNPDTRTNLAVTPEQISVGLPTAAGVTSADPITGTQATGLSLAGGRVGVSVGADPVILSVSTGATASALAQGAPAARAGHAMAQSQSQSQPQSRPRQRFSGRGPRVLGTITVPAPGAVLRWTSRGGRFRFSNRIGVAVNSTARSGELSVPPLTYRRVTVRARGRWSIQISPLTN